MLGLWHIPAIATCASILAVLIDEIIFLIVALFWLTLLKLFKRLNTLPFIVSLTALIFFYFYIPALQYNPPQTEDNDDIRITGKISDPLGQTPQKLQFSLREERTAEQYLIIYFPEDNEQLQRAVLENIKYGATCQIDGNISPPQRARNPGQFDHSKFLEERGIKTQIIISSLDNISCQGESFLHNIFGLRQYLLQNVQQLASETTAPWLQALVLGDRTYLSNQIIDLFQRWGLSHLLAISGLHVGIIIASLYFIFVRLGLFTKEMTEWLLLSFLPIFAIIAGSEPSVLRASLMIIVFLLINKIKLSFQLQDTISVVFLLLIIFNPLVVYHVGFQFSFLVTFALILSRQWLNKTTSAVWQLFIISYVSQMIILPLQFHYFYTFQPLSIIINLLIVPYFSLFVIPLMFLLIPVLLLMPQVAERISLIFDPLQNTILNLLFFIDQYFYLPIVLGSFPLLAAVIYYVIFIISLKYIEQYHLKRAFQYSILFVLVIIVLYLRPYFSTVGQVTMLDIGQGDAFVIELPYRRGVFFVDAGATVSFTDYEVTDKVYQQVIKPFLHSRGIQKVDAIILSHAHIDHNGSSQFIVEDFHTSLIIVSEFYELRADERAFIETNDIELMRFRGNDSFTLKGQPFTVLAPLVDEHDTDDNSLVLQTNFGGREWLFTGDIGKNIERKIKTTYKNHPIDVLKVAHHGSKTSTDQSFISHFKPEIALISVGERNIYGHPNIEVIQTLTGADVTVLRTDEHGAVQYIFTTESGTFYTFLP